MKYKKHKKKFKENDGITLIVLVVTIIVILILIGVTITTLSGQNGIINRVAESKEDTEKTETIEQIELGILELLSNKKSSKYTRAEVYTIAENITGNVPTEDSETGKVTVITQNGYVADITEIVDKASVSWYYSQNAQGDTIITNGTDILNIGDEVKYTPEAGKKYISSSDNNGYQEQIFTTDAYTGTWQVLGADESTGELLILSSNVIDTSDVQYFYFQGPTGYVNFINELNEVCEIFGTGNKAVKARSITVDDVNKITGYDPSLNFTEGNGELYEYGNEVTYYWKDTEYPYYSAPNNKQGNLSEIHNSFNWFDGSYQTSTRSLSGEQITTLKSTDYWYNGQSYLDTSIQAYNMIFNLNENYWLASLSTICRTTVARFCCRVVFAGTVNGTVVDSSYLFDSTGATGCFNYGVRAVVYLDTDVSLNGSSASGWSISE